MATTMRIPALSMTKIDGVDLKQALEYVRIGFFEIASKAILPMPDDREFQIHYPQKAPEKFDMHMTLILTDKQKYFELVGKVFPAEAMPNEESAAYAIVKHRVCFR